MRVICIIVIVLSFAAIAVGQLQPASADVPLDYEIPNGRFFTQTNGAPGVEPFGYAVSNDGDVPMWNEFQRLGGVASLGYPVSRRFQLHGFSSQAFQKAVLQWRPEAGQAWSINVFDLLHDLGKDSWLLHFRSTPAPLPPDFDGGKLWPAVVAGRQALLDENAAIKRAYFAASDPMTFYGLPVSRVVDNGNHFVIRLQRAIIQQWKADVPWAKAGQVTVANGGDIAKEAGILPEDAIPTELPPWGAGRVVAIDAGHGGAEIGAAYRFADGTKILEKDLNLRVALKVANLLARAGYKPVMTRTADTEVNKPPKLLTRRPPVGLDDELQARIDIANQAAAKLFLSIHFNGHSNSNLRGSEIYYCKDRPFASDSRRFADLLSNNLSRGLAGIGYKDHDSKVKYDSQALGPNQHFYLLGPSSETITRSSEMPAVLAEGLFVTNGHDANMLRIERTLDVIARAYATGVHQYFAGSPQAELPGPPSGSPLPTATPTPTATTTPKPTATPTPAPRATPKPSTPPALGQGTIVVDYGGGANLRAEPKSSAATVAGIPHGAAVDLLQAVAGEPVLQGDTRWYRARYEGHEGYVYAALVKRPGDGAPTPTPSPSASLGRGAVTAESGGLLRAQPTTSSDIVMSLATGTEIDLLATVTGEPVLAGDTRWYRAKHNGRLGYVYATVVQRAGQAPGRGTIASEAGGAMMRSAPAISSRVVDVLADGTEVSLLGVINGDIVIGDEARWYRVRHDGREGYVYAALVRR